MFLDEKKSFIRIQWTNTFKHCQEQSEPDNHTFSTRMPLWSSAQGKYCPVTDPASCMYPWWVEIGRCQITEINEVTEQYLWNQILPSIIKFVNAKKPTTLKFSQLSTNLFITYLQGYVRHLGFDLMTYRKARVAN